MALAWLASTAAAGAPQVILPRIGLAPDDVAVIINDEDPLSRRVGAYYAEARGIPAGNLIHVSFPPGRSALPADEFGRLRERVLKSTPTHVQAYAVAWTQPYRVGCMGMTAALASGFDAANCANSCAATQASPYFDSAARYPWGEHAMRPAMMLAGSDFPSVQRLIDRGVASDGSFPAGKAYLLSTRDHARNVRAAYFDRTAALLGDVLPVDIVAQNVLADRDDVLFYFTGLPQVPELLSLKFQPGALADHLTSFGGQLTDSSQMSSLRWLEAGATASYGTVVEPCNHPQKFPFPAIAMAHYAAGESAIEAYWKSVAWPGEGVFIGEPLARPFAPRLTETGEGRYELTFMALRPGRLTFSAAESPMGPFRPLPQAMPVHKGKNVIRFTLPATLHGFVRVNW